MLTLYRLLYPLEFRRVDDRSSLFARFNERHDNAVGTHVEHLRATAVVRLADAHDAGDADIFRGANHFLNGFVTVGAMFIVKPKPVVARQGQDAGGLRSHVFEDVAPKGRFAFFAGRLEPIPCHDFTGFLSVSVASRKWRIGPIPRPSDASLMRGDLGIFSPDLLPLREIE